MQFNTGKNILYEVLRSLTSPDQLWDLSVTYTTWVGKCMGILPGFENAWDYYLDGLVGLEHWEWSGWCWW